jgi:hypothetical protein
VERGIEAIRSNCQKVGNSEGGSRLMRNPYCTYLTRFQANRRRKLGENTS